MRAGAAVIAALVVGGTVVGCGGGPEFHGTVRELDEATRGRMVPSSWRQGCPVPLDDLRLVVVDHWGFDGRVHRGELVVHADHAPGVLSVFQTLFEQRFPIEHMRLVDDYGGDDERSMAANNTSGFNCRLVADGERWSEHAYGRAVDVNPVQNPYVSPGGRVAPAAGSAHLDRSRDVKGMIRPGDEVVRAFASIGWSWGGSWRSAKDYQHFSSTGR